MSKIELLAKIELLNKYEAMIEEMKADGIPTEDNEDLAADMRRANNWATIGVGVAGYYRR